MATANIDLPDGTKVTIDGSPDEITKILGIYSKEKQGSNVSQDKKRNSPVDTKKKNSKKGVSGHIRELIEEDFFNTKRSIADLQGKLEEMGQVYPLTHLSTPLRRLVRSRELRRMKESNNWLYVKN